MRRRPDRDRQIGTMQTFQRVGPLFTDLYELTMAAGYWANGILDRATFSVFVRGDQTPRNYFVAAGLEEALAELAGFSFSLEEIGFLSDTGRFSDAFLTHLSELKFTGDIMAMPEGTIFFADEPILEISAPIIQAQLVETFILNCLGFQTLVATKAVRCRQAAGDRPLIDFSLRRTQGTDAGMKVARCTWMAGFDATSNVLAGMQYGIPLSGTMAHSFVTAFDSESDAFAAYARTFPESTVLLIDTYDVIQGARNAVKIGTALQRQGKALVGVRLDSGDMVSQSRKVRKILDSNGFSRVKIFASSGFDEFKIADVIRRGAAIDAFGVGTRVGVSADAPFLDIVYKMVRYADRNVRKVSPGKVTLGGEKQVFRNWDGSGKFAGDVITERNETRKNAVALLEPAMASGTAVGKRQSLEDIRQRVDAQLKAMDPAYLRLTDPAGYPVSISRKLEAIQKPA